MIRPRSTVHSQDPTQPPALAPPATGTMQVEPDTPMSHYPRGHVHASSESLLAQQQESSAASGSGEYFSGSEVDEKEREKGRRNERGGLQGRRGSGQSNLSLKLERLGLGGVLGKKGKGSKFGLTQQGWILVTAILGFIIFLKLVIPSSSSYSSEHHKTTDTAHLIPRDYLNNSLVDTAPFEFCPVFGPGDAIASRRGQFELLRSRLHLGTGARVQRVLQKAMSGAPVTISILGGSVSACMGAGDDPTHEKCYPHRLFDWWNTVFPHPANELTNGATPKTDSAYYAYCNSHHLPDKTDLVILEFDAADPNDPEWLQHFELLVRSVLVRPEMPAVIILGHFSPQVQAQNGFAGPEILHNVVGQFYDVPHISVKGLLYEQYLASPDQARSAFYNDPAHANFNGHGLISDILVSYLQSQVCAGWSAITGHGFDVPDLGTESDATSAGSPSLLGGVGLRKGMPGQDPGDGVSAGSSLADRYQGLRVPQMRIADKPHDVQKFREIEPFCVAASNLINPLPDSLFLGSGWKPYHPPKGAVQEDRHYWYAEQPTARLRVPLVLGAGDVGIYFLQSPPDKPLGVVKCWVDDNYAGNTELHGTAEVEDVIATLVMIDRNVEKGSHFVECQLQGEVGGSSNPFKILGM
ncbi:hypothetical protein IAR50_000126 [Cryptococcus sp. DSM 104548]